MKNSNITPFLKDTDFGDETYVNVQQNYIYITEDKIKLILISVKENWEKNHNWVNPLSLFITLILVLLTSDLKDLWGIDKNLLKGFLYALTFVFFIWFIFSIISNIRREKVTIESVIEKIKQNNKQPT